MLLVHARELGKSRAICKMNGVLLWVDLQEIKETKKEEKRKR